MKVRIILDVPDEYADPDHQMGITEDGFLLLHDALSGFGFDIIQGPDKEEDA